MKMIKVVVGMDLVGELKNPLMERCKNLLVDLIMEEQVIGNHKRKKLDISSPWW